MTDKLISARVIAIQAMTCLRVLDVPMMSLQMRPWAIFIAWGKNIVTNRGGQKYEKESRSGGFSGQSEAVQQG